MGGVVGLRTIINVKDCVAPAPLRSSLFRLYLEYLGPVTHVLMQKASVQVDDLLMREAMFDETYNIREVLDDVIERVTIREKLIATAKQFSEKKREERFNLAVRQFESLMGDFLRLYQPILDRMRSYRDGLQKELSGLRSALATVNGMLEVSRGLEGLAGRIPQLEADGQELETTIKEKSKIAEKIDDLMNRIRAHPMAPGQMGRDPLSDVLSGMPKDLYPDMPETGKEVTKKAGSRN